MTLQFELTAPIRKRLKKRGFDLVCQRCGKEIQIGQKVVSVHNIFGTRHYHENCYDRMLVRILASARRTRNYIGSGRY